MTKIVFAIIAILVSALPVSAQQKEPLTFLISGHSLSDEPIGEYVTLIAKSLGRESDFQRQSIPGSPISMRTVGHRNDPRDPARFPWTGYRSGDGRWGKIDLVKELRKPAVAGRQYSAVVVAERHDSLGPLQWEMTVPTLRHVYELAREGSPQVRGYFYATWLDLVGPGSSRDDPAGWVAFEREQLKLWEAITSRINDSLEKEGRPDRMTTLPASGAIAELVHRATTGNVPGITGKTKRETIDRLFSDDVHQTDLGKYYTACVVYAALTRQSPVGAALPPGVDRQAGTSLQQLAWNYTSAYYKDRPTGPHHAWPERREVGRRFGPIFWAYTNRPDQGRGAAEFFGKASPDNPLYFDAARDESTFWLPHLP